MRTELLIVTYERDFVYLRYCLRSIAKFARGFSQLRILVPHEHVEACQPLTWCGIEFPFKVQGFEEWPEKGFLCHEYQILTADKWCPDADFIGHLDADCCFTEPVTPDDYIQDGKPFLRFEPYAKIIKRHDSMRVWQDCTQACLPFPVKAETMRAHPGVFRFKTYSTARAAMVAKTGEPVEDYVKKQRNEFPQSISEYNVLGSVAIALEAEHYHLVEQTNDCPTPDNKLLQCWSHSNIDHPQRIWIKGVERDIVPIEEFRKLGLDGDVTRYKPSEEEKARMTE